MITIENEYLRVTIAAKGAELQQLFHKQTGLQYLWSGDAVFWGKFSPVLFPIVGTLKDDTYYYKEQAYQLPRHGFARERIFLQEQISASEAVFTLGHDAQTLAVYPFAFSLQLHYKLTGNQLTCQYKVQNPGYDEMYFSLGAHPAFAVPLIPGETYQQYHLHFNRDQVLHRWKLIDGLIDTHAEELPLQQQTLPLDPSLFEQDAIVLKNLQSNQIRLANNSQSHGLDFAFEGFPFFGIWAAKAAPFVCLEPWCGIADSVTHNQQLVQKEGVMCLQPDELWERSWSVTCF